MATTTSLTTTYAGKYAQEYIMAALLVNNAFTNGFITVKTNVQPNQLVKRIALSGNLWQDAQCTFNDDGTVTIDERKILPKNFQINKTLCKTDFLNDWETQDMGNSANSRQLAKRLQDAFVTKVLSDHQARLAVQIWQGVEGAGAIDGYETLFAADSDVIDVSSPITITAENVIDEIGRTLDAAPDELRQMPNFAVGVAPDVYYKLVRALGGFGTTGHAGINNQGPLNTYQDSIPFENTRVIMCNGMSAGSMVATYKENLWFGTLSLADHGSIKLRDQDDVDGSDAVKFIAKFNCAVQYGFGGDIVYYAGA